MTDETPLPGGGEVTIALRTPLRTIAGETIDKLVLRDNTARHWLDLDTLEGVLIDIAALSFLTGLPRRDIENLTARDFRAARATMNAFVSSLEEPVPDDEAARTLTLAMPITDTDGDQVTELRLREPLAKDLDSWDRLSGVAKDLQAVETITGLSHEVACRLGIRDFRAATAWIATFFDDALAAGA